MLHSASVMIEFQSVHKTFSDPRGGEITAVKAFDLVVRDGEPVPPSPAPPS